MVRDLRKDLPSRPTWARGLKQENRYRIAMGMGRAPRGRVD